MLPKLTIVFLTAAALVRPVAAADVDLSKLPPASDKKDVTYVADIQPIFKASCLGCHGAQRPRAGLRLDSLEASLKGGDKGVVITPGKSDKSPLVIAVARLDPKKAMPPMRRPGRPGPGGPGAPGQGDQGGPPAPPADAPGAGAPPPPDAHAAAQPPGDAPGGTPPPGGPGPGGPGGQGGPRGRGGPPAKPLTPEQVGLIRAWIDQGAK